MNTPVNLIGPDVPKAVDFMDKVPTVKNTANIAPVVDTEGEINFVSPSSMYWSEREPKYKNFYDKGFATGKHIGFNSDISTSLIKVLTKLKSEILTNVFRSNDKTIKHIKFVLDILDSLDDNVEHVMKNENIKIDERELTAYVHGFINAIVNNKTTKEKNESRNKANE